jgi:polyhydroxybutyrate depolymerase
VTVRLRRTHLVASALALALVTAACSSGGSSPSASAPGATSTTTSGSAHRTSSTSVDRQPIGRDPSTVPARRSPGCGGYAAPTAGTRRVDVRSGDLDRWYLLSVPGSVSSDVPAPLVVDLHGYLEGAELHARVSDLSSLGERKGFLTVTPQGQGDPVHWDTTLTSPDVRFVDSILDQVEATTCIDLARVYATGFSNGAFMSSTLACVDANRFAAVAPVAGIRDVPGCSPSRPVPVIAFHGTADEFVTYEGGLGSGAAKLPAVDSKSNPGKTMADADDPTGSVVLPGSIDDSVPHILDVWSKRNGCSGRERASKVTSDVDLVRERCPDGREAEVYRVSGGGHAWPGSTVGATLDVVTGHTTDSVDATALIWAFFADHPMGAG